MLYDCFSEKKKKNCISFGLMISNVCNNMFIFNFQLFMIRENHICIFVDLSGVNLKFGDVTIDVSKGEEIFLSVPKSYLSVSSQSATPISNFTLETVECNILEPIPLFTSEASTTTQQVIMQNNVFLIYCFRQNRKKSCWVRWTQESDLFIIQPISITYTF